MVAFLAVLPFVVGACHRDDTVEAPTCGVASVGKSVFVLGVTGLDPPAVGPPAAYRPARFVSLSEATDSPPATAFVVHLIAEEDAAEVRVRLRTGESEPVDLLEFPSRTDSLDAWLAGDWIVQDRVARDALLAGIGAFARLDSEESPSTMQTRLGVVLPGALLETTVRLELFNCEINGVPVGGDHLTIARDFFYMGVVGDSIAWGNGLRRRDKLTRIVRDTVEQELGLYVVLQNFSQSGATIVPGPADRPCGGGCWGETPRVPTSLTTQAALLQRPDLLDLVIVGGCINDVGLGTILDPFVDPDQLAEETELACDVAMSQLVTDLRLAAPRAAIVLLGLYPIVSEQSDLLGVQRVSELFTDEPVTVFEGLVEALSENSRVFAQTANEALTRVVQRMAGEGTAIAVAIPEFGPDNAIFAPEGWLWNLAASNADLPGLGFDIDLLPEDPLTIPRWEACFARGQTAGLILCLFASVGHPNPQGAHAYAEQIIARLREVGLLPLL